MSEQSGQEKTEQPTPKKLQEASDEGRIARSQEMATAALMIGGGMTLSLLAPGIGSRLLSLFGESLARMSLATDVAADINLLQHTGWTVIVVVGILCVITASFTLLVGGLQARGTFTPKPMMPKWNRINPLTNAKNIFSTRAPVELLKSILKICIVAAVAWSVLRNAWPELMDLGSRDASSLILTLKQYGAKLFLVAGFAYLILAALDYGWQLWQHHKQLRMTKHEVKQESKQQEGDPLLKARIRSIARARVRKQMLRDVPKADVVIVNPTHRAVALRYDPMVAPAPVVLAMGERKVAERIKEIAAAHDVPVIENKPLAIALIASAKVGTMIPAELYVAVAEVLAFVFRQRAMSDTKVMLERGDA